MQDFEEKLAHLWFDGEKDAHVALRKKLLSLCGSVEEIYNASEPVLKKLLGDDVSSAECGVFLEKRNKDRLSSLLGELSERGIFLLYPSLPDYPQKLRHIYDAPRLLFARGKLLSGINNEKQNIAIIGSRNADIYFSETTRRFARELAKSGINIVSGMARGIDSQAHWGCLAAEGYTVAVLGSGINVPYPRGNAELYDRIAKNGLILSEYGLDKQPYPHQFPHRNRLISGLSDGVLVACAGEKSGSLITADLALEQGRTVYAFPGRPTDSISKGNNRLIQMGALLVTEPEDLLRDLWGESKFSLEGEKSEMMQDFEEICEKNALAPMEKIVYSLLGLDPLNIDEVIAKARIGVTNTISALYALEVKGLIKQPLNGYYIWNL